MTLNDTDTLNSRRTFLKRLACGSVLAIGSTGIAGAAVRHLTNTKNTSHKDKHAVKVAHDHKDKHATKQIHDHQAKHAVKVAHNNIQAPEHARQHDVIHTTKRNEIHPHRVIHSSQKDAADSTQGYVFRSRQNSDVRRNYLSDAKDLSHKSLALQNMNTGEKLNLTYFEEGRYLNDSLSEINRLFRDHHTDEIHSVDTALLDQLHDLQQSLGVNKPYSLVCGYRSPATNGMMHFFNHGVAKHSLHMEGRAIDLRIQGVNTHDIKTAALALGRGGVGYYPESNFVHLDTGGVRTW